jgi:hypothetical protein
MTTVNDDLVDEFRDVIQTARGDFLSSPLDKVLGDVSNAAECAEKVGDERAGELRALEARLRDAYYEFDECERELWRLFGPEDNSMERDPNLERE